MKVSELIKKLEKIKDKFGNIDVLVDYDENGWYDLEKVQLIKNHPLIEGAEFREPFINIKSSNEA